MSNKKVDSRIKRSWIAPRQDVKDKTNARLLD